MEEPDLYKKSAMKNMKIPYWLVLKRYWVRLAAISLTWCVLSLYDNQAAYAYGGLI